MSHHQRSSCHVGDSQVPPADEVHQFVAALELLYNIDYVGIVRIECYSGLATGWRDNTVSG